MKRVVSLVSAVAFVVFWTACADQDVTSPTSSVNAPLFSSHNGGTVVVVTEGDIGDTWHIESQLVDGSYAFVSGPGAPPFGAGSLELTAPNLSTDKITVVTDRYFGGLLSFLEGLEYWTYRDGSSTSPGHTVPSINIFITNAGPDGTVAWAPLVWEPIYPFGAEAIEDDEWQEWDTFAESQTGFAGGWWSTRTLGTICEFNCFVSWQTVLDQNPAAAILGIGINLGRGPAGSFFGAADGLSVTFDGETTTFDFDLVLNPETLSDCMNGGWQAYGFRNQGQCIRFVNTGKDDRIGE